MPMKYIKTFNTDQEYLLFTATDYAKPNISYTILENTVYYNPMVVEN